tara:strand:- start:354 stop:599 length:246 start_codon:yes stop_codon:yes gene_type:complete
MSLNNLIQKLDQLNKEIAKEEDINMNNDSNVDDYTSSVKDDYILLDLNRNLKIDVINYTKLVKNNIRLCNRLINNIENKSK